MVVWYKVMPLIHSDEVPKRASSLGSLIAINMTMMASRMRQTAKTREAADWLLGGGNAIADVDFTIAHRCASRAG